MWEHADVNTFFLLLLLSLSPTLSINIPLFTYIEYLLNRTYACQSEGAILSRISFIYWATEHLISEDDILYSHVENVIVIP